jgi:hypothetical protein
MTDLELPATDPDLVFLTRLMQLAVNCRTMLRDRKYVFPEASDQLLRMFYPALGKYILEVETASDLGMHLALTRFYVPYTGLYIPGLRKRMTSCHTTGIVTALISVGSPMLDTLMIVSY